MAQVLIAGAGPTGLVAALVLARAGVAVRIVDRLAEPSTTSRAVAVQARTLEFYRQLGLAEAIVAAGHKVPAINLWTRGRRAARVPLAQFGAEFSAYGFPLIHPQDEHERLLIAALEVAGVQVERSVELVTATQTADGVRATLRGPGGEETCEVPWLVGCDGAGSEARHAIGASFPGGTYEHQFYVADVAAAGPASNGELHVDLEDADFLAVFPLAAPGHVRLVGTVRGERAPDAGPLTFADVSDRALHSLRVEVSQVNWFSTYRVHHRVADRFRQGRIFLAGDAAHIHSPVGGQGMNTGIGDAVNLAWKLAMVVRGEATEGLLDSYEPERIGFARRLVATTDRVFVAATSSGGLARFIRTQVAPRVVPLVARTRRGPKTLFRIVSQTAIAYPGSPLSGPGGGARLPWTRLAGGGDNFQGLQGFAWRTQLYGEAPAGLAERLAELGAPLTVIPWEPALERAGFARDALYLLRPDAQIALQDPARDPEAVALYFTQRGLRPATTA